MTVKCEWTPAIEQKLRTLWGARLTASQIAVQLGRQFTRSMVLGKAHRLGLTSQKAPERYDDDEPPPRTRKSLQRQTPSLPRIGGGRP